MCGNVSPIKCRNTIHAKTKCQNTEYKIYNKRSRNVTQKTLLLPNLYRTRLKKKNNVWYGLVSFIWFVVELL